MKFHEKLLWFFVVLIGIEALITLYAFLRYFDKENEFENSQTTSSMKHLILNPYSLVVHTRYKPKMKLKRAFFSVLTPHCSYFEPNLMTFMTTPSHKYFDLILAIDETERVPSCITELLSFYSKQIKIIIKFNRKTDVVELPYNNMQDIYYYSINKIFTELKYDTITLLDNSEKAHIITKDYFTLHLQTERLIVNRKELEDKSLFCVIAFNGINDQKSYKDLRKFYRTSVNNGGSIMFTSKDWESLSNLWKNNQLNTIEGIIQLYMDSTGLECIYPGVSRVFRTDRSNMRLYNEESNSYNYQYISKQYDSYKFGDLSYLDEKKYEQYFKDTLSKCSEVLSSDIYTLQSDSQSYILFSNNDIDSFYSYISSDKTYNGFWRGNLLIDSGDTKSLILMRKTQNPYISLVMNITERINDKVLIGKPGEDCNTVCNGQNYNCNNDELYTYNNCKKMKDYFKCENGCSYQEGEHFPSYNMMSHNEQPGVCLLQFRSKLMCKHTVSNDTQRLCVCSPK